LRTRLRSSSEARNSCNCARCRSPNSRVRRSSWASLARCPSHRETRPVPSRSAAEPLLHSSLVFGGFHLPGRRIPGRPTRDGVSDATEHKRVLGLNLRTGYCRIDGSREQSSGEHRYPGRLGTRCCDDRVDARRGSVRFVSNVLPTQK
jgi:hypothetical protein